MASHTKPARTLRLAGLMVLSLVAPLLLPVPAHASSQLALDKGCYTCHGNPPRKNAPTFAELASRYAKHRGNTRAENDLVEKLRQGSFLGHIDAHERLSQDDARRLVRWIIEGAR
ncbi:MAG: c-type cytochrome [Polaromonas sp.]|nr:c-type cytochrome [Polaromonas sp.]